MINILPNETETLVVTHEWDEVLRRLMAVTKQVGEVGEATDVLAGWVKDDRFQLIIRQRRLNSFMPLVEGKIDPTTTGCLIFLQYRLMPITRMYLILWTVIAVVSGFFLSFYYTNFLFSLASAGIVVLVYGIAWANFKIHHKPLHDVIFRVLEVSNA